MGLRPAYLWVCKQVFHRQDRSQDSRSQFKGCNILHCFSALLQNRKGTIQADIEEGMDDILRNFPADVKNIDVIIDHRAEDSYFSFARDF